MAKDQNNMNQSVIVTLLIIAIVFSAISVILNLSILSAGPVEVVSPSASGNAVSLPSGGNVVIDVQPQPGNELGISTGVGGAQ